MWVHRIVTSEPYGNCGPNDVLTWSMGQVADAHRYLDFHDKKESVYRRKRKKNMEID